MIGTILSNRYRLIAELGSGGMAWVYLAEDLREKEYVAVKVLYPQHSQDLNFLQRFAQESKLAMSLSQCHPQRHIVCVLDYGSDRDIHYLVMEFVPGQDLHRILEERGSLPWPETLHIARQVAMALHHAHEYEVVHRDIKPGNIMILPDGTVRVLDFGIARARTSPHLTLAGFVGSPYYAAPEQGRGEQVDIRADIYSLGIVMYRMLSGNLPFRADTPWAIVNQHIASPPPPLVEACPDLPNEVIDLVEKALGKRADDRFQTPQEMIDAIDEVLTAHDLPLQGPIPALQSDGYSLEDLYGRAQRALEAESWREAVNLFSQIIKVDPNYRDVSTLIAGASEQIRLAGLYRSAGQAIQLHRWDEAAEHLDEIAISDPDYRDVRELRSKLAAREALGSQAQDSIFDQATLVRAGDSDAAQALAAAGQEAHEQTRPSPPWLRSRRRTLLLVAAVLLLLAVPLAYLVLGREQPAETAPIPTQTPTSAATTQVLATATPSGSVAPSSEPSPTASIRPTPAAAAATVSLLVTDTPDPFATPSATTRPRLAGQIAFARFDPARQTYDVFTCPVNSATCQRIATEASQPDFLPGGSRLVVKSWKANDKGIEQVDTAGHRIWKISNLIEAARPSVDTQGQVYVYHARQEADRQPRLLRTFNADNQPIRREGSPVLGSSPAWLPDGRILYAGCIGDACGILLMDADGTDTQQVIPGSTETNPEASPDGRRLVFMSRRDGNWEVYLANLDGSGLTRLTNHPANDGLPTWSPDGRHIAFISDRDGSWAVWIMRPDGRDQMRLFPIGGPLDGQVRGAAPHELHGWVEERISWAPLP
ncbi:MAG: protein kinase [Anaerolineae bacterium]|jgi:serine/threonine protein kinase